MSNITPLSRNPFINRLVEFQGTTFNPDEQALLIELALGVLTARHQRGQALCSPEEVRAYLRLWLGEARREVFGLLHLDTKHRVLSVETLFEGTIDGATVHPRVVVEQVLAHNSAAVIMFHNHPSGVPDPSRADELLTQRLRDTLALIDVRVLDHFIVGATAVVSFAERGLL